MDKKKRKNFIKDIRGEYKKIIWPSKEELKKQTKVVILTSAILGAIIVAYDVVFSFLMDMIAKIV